LPYCNDARLSTPAKAYRAGEAGTGQPAARCKVGGARFAAFIVAYLLAQCTHADVIYVCNTQQDYISISDSEHAKTEPVEEQAEIIPASDDFHPDARDRDTNWTESGPMVRRCHLSSGDYVVMFDTYRTGAQDGGLPGGDFHMAVEIRHDQHTVLARTVVARCEIPHPQGALCKAAWVAEIRLSGRTGHVQLLRLIYLLNDQPGLNGLDASCNFPGTASRSGQRNRGRTTVT
jgi:hypothetical protein